MSSILVIVYAPFIIVGTMLSAALVCGNVARHAETLASLGRDVIVAECELGAAVRRAAQQVAPVAPVAPIAPATSYGIATVDYATLARIAARLEAERAEVARGSAPGPRALMARPIMGDTYVASSHYAEGWGVAGNIHVINRD